LEKSVGQAKYSNLFLDVNEGDKGEREDKKEKRFMNNLGVL
jgi:hypothetical protein